MTAQQVKQYLYSLLYKVNNLSISPSFTSEIPFNTIITSMSKTIDGATTFTKNTTDAKPGYGAIVRLTANGTNLQSPMEAVKENKMSPIESKELRGIINLTPKTNAYFP